MVLVSCNRYDTDGVTTPCCRGDLIVRRFRCAQLGEDPFLFQGSHPILMKDLASGCGS
jgi:hypothetical protein